MLQPRIDRDPRSPIFAPLAELPAINPVLPDIELETPPLPRDHPQWMRDSLAVSARCRGLFARIKPVGGADTHILGSSGSLDPGSGTPSLRRPQRLLQNR